MKRYLGDSVYADFDGWAVVLTTDNGLGPSNTIILEPTVFRELVEYGTRLLKRKDPRGAEPTSTAFNPDGSKRK